MPVQKKLSCSAKMDNLHTLLEYAGKFADQLGVDDEKRLQLELALEEILVNIICYAYQPPPGEIELACDKKQDNSLEVTIVDAGIPFNPLGQNTPDINASLEERDAGGLGIFLATKMVDDIHYSRANDRNIVTMTKRI
ncbi:ATP-binding protein [Algicola sagamiensis]|uniref:ATP-binding protein n=1 Tax=Algicola sagamiensis TaxID=163869 RepID=UPI000477D3A0|nr:ATP-binding protein [Algicola sagamiensis]